MKRNFSFDFHTTSEDNAGTVTFRLPSPDRGGIKKLLSRDPRTTEPEPDWPDLKCVEKGKTPEISGGKSSQRSHEASGDVHVNPDSGHGHISRAIGNHLRVFVTIPLNRGHCIPSASAADVVNRNPLGYTRSSDPQLQAQGLERFFCSGSKAGIQAQHAERLRLILGRLSVSIAPSDMNLPGLDLHPLKGDRKDTWAVKVSGNWRVTFTFIGKDADRVDYEDYH